MEMSGRVKKLALHFWKGINLYFQNMPILKLNIGIF